MFFRLKELELPLLPKRCAGCAGLHEHVVVLRFTVVIFIHLQLVVL